MNDALYVFQTTWKATNALSKRKNITTIIENAKDGVWLGRGEGNWQY